MALKIKQFFGSLTLKQMVFSLIVILFTYFVADTDIVVKS